MLTHFMIISGISCIKRVSCSVRSEIGVIFEKCCDFRDNDGIPIAHEFEFERELTSDRRHH